MFFCMTVNVKFQRLITLELIKPLALPQRRGINGSTILGCIRKCASILPSTFNHEC